MLFIEADTSGLGADKTFIEDSTGELVETFFLKRPQHTGADLGRQRDVIERNRFLFPLLPKPDAEGRHLIVSHPAFRRATSAQSIYVKRLASEMKFWWHAVRLAHV